MKKKKKKSIFSFLAWSLAVRGENRVRERKSILSLRSTAFEPSVLVGARGEVGLRCKGYAWVPVLWSFDKLWKIGSSPTRLFFV